MTAATKHCHGCGRDLPREAYDTDRRRRDGLQTRCRECRLPYMRAINHGANPRQSPARTYRRAPAASVAYVDPATRRERNSGTARACAWKRHYGDDLPIPSTLTPLCDAADAALRAEIRERRAAGRSLVLADPSPFARMCEALGSAPAAAD